MAGICIKHAVALGSPGWTPPPPWLECQRVLELGGGRTAAERREKYRQFAEEAVREGLPETLWKHLIGQVALGTREWWGQVRKSIIVAGREQPHWKAVRPRASWESVVQEVARVRGLPWQEFKAKRGDWGRDLALYFGRMECGLGLKELGTRAGAMDYATIGLLRIKLFTGCSLERAVKRVGKCVVAN